MPKQKIKINNKEDWTVFTLGYLNLAELVLTELVYKKYKKIGPYRTDFNIKDIYLPALFNLKHGIEIFLKTFSIEFLNKDSLDSSDFTHDIDEIFSKLRKTVPEERLQKAIEKYEDKNPNQKGRLTGKSIYDELKNLVEKYHCLLPLRDKIGKDFSIKDTENTALKYPTNSLGIQINYKKVARKFTMKDVKSSRTDCLILQSTFFQLSLLLLHEREPKNEALKSKIARTNV